MAYQPFPNRVPSIPEFVTNGTQPVTMATAGTDYILWAISIKPGAGTFTGRTELVSMLAQMAGRAIEFRFAYDLTFAGNALVFEETAPGSKLLVAYGDGSQAISDGIFIQGRYVPGGSERDFSGPPFLSNDLPTVMAPDFVAYMTGRGFANNAKGAARAEIQIILVDDEGNPIEPPPNTPAEEELVVMNTVL